MKAVYMSMFYLYVQFQPLEAVEIIAAAKEEVRTSSNVKSRTNERIKVTLCCLYYLLFGLFMALF